MKYLLSFVSQTHLRWTKQQVTALNRRNNHPIQVGAANTRDMVEIDERLLEDATHQGQNLLTEELVKLIERYHSHEQPGVSQGTLKAYAKALEEESNYDLDAETFLSAVDERLTDTKTWYRDDALYEIDANRVSVYPPHWHEKLGGSTDLRAYIQFLVDTDSGFQSDTTSGGAGRGVPEQVLLDIVSVVGRVDRDTVKARLEDLRDNGELVQDADQHPNARIRLTERANNLRDSSLDS